MFRFLNGTYVSCTEHPFLKRHIPFLKRHIRFLHGTSVSRAARTHSFRKPKSSGAIGRHNTDSVCAERRGGTRRMPGQHAQDKDIRLLPGFNPGSLFQKHLNKAGTAFGPRADAHRLESFIVQTRRTSSGEERINIFGSVLMR